MTTLTISTMHGGLYPLTSTYTFENHEQAKVFLKDAKKQWTVVDYSFSS